MKVSARELNRATLARQLLLRRERLPVTEAVRRVVALQAQEPASPYLALWNRLDGFDPAELDVAFAVGDLVKATLLRITLHAVHTADYRDFHQAMQPTLRGSRLYDKRFAVSGLAAAQADDLAAELLAFAAEPRTNEDMENWLGARISGEAKGAWWGLRTFLPVRHAPDGGAWSFGLRPSYVASGIPLSPDDQALSGHALRVLARRYLEGFGPASAPDLAQFALVQRARAREALAGQDLERLGGPDGTVLYDVPGAARPPGDTPAPPRLLGMWESVALAYADRARIIPPEYRKLLIRNNGDTLPALLVDGYVAGVWRTAGDGIEVTAFRPLTAADWAGLATEAAGLLALLAARDTRPYRRYGRWWDGLPAAEVRVLR